MAQSERVSINIPPLLIGAENYNDWKFRMKIFLQRDAYECDAVENGITIPMKEGKPKPLKDLSPEEVNALNYNAKAMNALLSGMAATELRKVSACTTPKQIWDTIQVSHEGTSKVREVKLSMLISDHEAFRLERDESVKDAQGRFLTLMNSISLLDKIIPQAEINRKILRGMPKKFSSKVTILQDSPSISTMETLTLFSELEEFENQIHRYDEEDEAPRKKTLALNANAGDSSEDSDEEIALLNKKFHKFLAKKIASKRPMKSSFPKKEFKPNSSKESKNNQNKDACFECGKKGHFKKDCYKLKAKKKALLTWSDDDSEVEIDSDDELAQICFAGLEYDSSDNDEVCFKVHVPRNKWIIDSGCSRHMIGDKSKFLSLIAKEGGLVTLGDSNTVRIVGKGTIGNDKFAINNVRLVDGLKYNLISVIQLTDVGHSVKFDKDVYYIGNKANEFALVAKRKGNIFVLDFDEQQEEICLANVQEQQNLWHRRLGHVHMDLLRKISSHELVRGLPKLKYKKSEPCSACQLEKQLLHLDLFGPERYLKTIRSDRGGEFEKDFITFCKTRGITHEFSAPRTPQQNGVVERKNRTLQETARTLLHESNLPRKFWAEASTEGIFLGYSTTSKAYRVYNSIKHKFEESIDITLNDSALKISQIEEDVDDQSSHSQMRQSQSQKGQVSQEKSDCPRTPDSSNSSGNSQDSPQTSDQWSNDSFTSQQGNSIQ
ncbi:uncharacterized protein LOC141685153 [Apium graveolens]|uniref:uncharacterized protein LOC141685153 n=1 Tax=Apium graveolens TaxID=4045 RepID=UPI003D7B98B8